VRQKRTNNFPQHQLQGKFLKLTTEIEIEGLLICDAGLFGFFVEKGSYFSLFFAV
jgi:hypothetical protein